MFAFCVSLDTISIAVFFNFLFLLLNYMKISLDTLFLHSLSFFFKNKDMLVYNHSIMIILRKFKLSALLPKIKSYSNFPNLF